MYRKPPGSFGAIVEVDDRAFDGIGMFEAFGLEPSDDVLPHLNDWVKTAIIHPGFGGRVQTVKPPPPDGEPEAWLLATDNHLRSGVLITIASVDEAPTLVGASVFFDGGVEHRFELERIIVPKHRTCGLLEGTLDGVVGVTMYEPAFASDRQWHGAGSDHQVAVYGVCYWLTIGVPPPMEIADPLDRASGETRTIHFDQAAILMSVKDAPAWLYDIVGRVTRVSEYEMPVLKQVVWKLRVVVVRIDAGEEEEKDVEIDLFVARHGLGGKILPVSGDTVQARIALCCRLWIANPVR